MAAAKKKAAKKVTATKVSAKKSASGHGKTPTPESVAASMGCVIPAAMKPDQINRLRKALPGYAAILDDVAALLAEEAGVFQIPGVTPEALLEAQARQKFLAAREGVAQAVHRSLYEQRLQADDVAMKMLEKVARRVSALKEDDATLVVRYKLLMDFLATFRTGGARASAGEAAPGPGETAAPVA